MEIAFLFWLLINFISLCSRKLPMVVALLGTRCPAALPAPAPPCTAASSSPVHWPQTKPYQFWVGSSSGQKVHAAFQEKFCLFLSNCGHLKRTWIPTDKPMRPEKEEGGRKVKRCATSATPAPWASHSPGTAAGVPGRSAGAEPKHPGGDTLGKVHFSSKYATWEELK